MCVIGATVNRDPQSIRKMLHANPDGTTDVKFPGSRRVRVPRLTDSEIALTSSAEDQGIWVNVLEKAFGTVKYAQPKTQHSDDEIDLDVISRGGKILSTIQLMTGHKAFAITIRQYKSKKYHLPTRADMPRMLARLDSTLSKAFAANRIVCADIAAGVKGKDIPPGLSGRHAYAVLGYDPATHIVTVWNPHGKDYKPKASPPNPTNGYTVKKGVFEIPLKDFARVFKAVTYETSASLTAAANPKRRRGQESLGRTSPGIGIGDVPEGAFSRTPRVFSRRPARIFFDIAWSACIANPEAVPSSRRRRAGPSASIRP